MKKLKNLFATPKKAAITIVCIAACAVVVGVGTKGIANAAAEHSAIGIENAKNFAFADAGIDPVAAKMVRAEFDREQGQFVYEIEFNADGMEYEYWIRASDGSVVKKQVEIITSDGDDVMVSAQITLDTAKATAVEDAGLTVSDVTFTKEALDVDDGLSVYDIEFYAQNVEYEYEINAETGAIYSKSKETFAADAAGAGGAQQNAPASGGASSSGTPSQGLTSGSSGQGGGSQSQSGSGQIGIEEAKSKALADAGLSASDVTFTKEKQDYDDGITVYDIEFYTASHEYEYEINAATGAVVDKSVEAYSTSGSGHHSDSHHSGSQSTGGQSTDSGSGSGGGQSAGADIGLDKAKSIAVGHAGFSVSDVSFSKAKLDNDDGYTVYEIEFYKDNMEYEYTINASTGTIMDYDSGYDD